MLDAGMDNPLRSETKSKREFLASRVRQALRATGSAQSGDTAILHIILLGLLLCGAGSCTSKRVEVVPKNTVSEVKPSPKKRIHKPNATPTEPTYHWKLIAGKDRNPGHRDGPGVDSLFYNPEGIAMDAKGSLFVADGANCVIRKITPDGRVCTFAGSPGRPSSADGKGSEAGFHGPQGIALDAQGTFYVTDTFSHTVRKMTPDGIVSTLAGKPGEKGTADGKGEEARFNQPAGIALDVNGNVFVADHKNHSIRKISPAGEVTTFAGSASDSHFANGKAVFVDGKGTESRFYSPTGLAFDASGFLYVTDIDNGSIRKISPDGVVSTLTGLEWEIPKQKQPGEILTMFPDGPPKRYTGLNHPAGLAIDKQGNIFIADDWNHAIRKINTRGQISTIGGKMSDNRVPDSSGKEANFIQPHGILVSPSGTLYVSDWLGRTIYRGVPR